MPAWLAFTVLNTKSNVELLGSRWREAGWLVVGLCGVFMGAQAIVYATAPEAALRSLGALYVPFKRSGQLEWGWLIGYFLVSALTEELLFRGLIQRALEGYLRRPYAISIQAVSFELVHVLHGARLSGGFVFGGVVFGLAFARTRSVGLATCLHLAGNLVHALCFARFAAP
ncbi:hypothetical protein DB30_07156 [Enhygromyxa salina]|uniref:CAAX prenyl protease 2/Lysostaphin resistance protein A-like domain-containing protein n=1 Tax=Enhygromyxa salina TaxID=215803 RepID=A0A0C2DBM0_9BACT|nr:CPBP family intramembrane glutamic endopeptidase [Enhygromyxa salina]KIG18820.1 hypothetical protein DB30_07156 [Enhygromyxa salina]